MNIVSTGNTRGVDGPQVSAEASNSAWTTPAGPDRLGLFLAQLRRQWLLALAVVACSIAASVALAFGLPSWWRAEITVMPVMHDQNRLGSITASASSLSMLVGGITGLGARGASTEEEAMAVLGSREIFDTYATTENLLPILFAEKWDSNNNRWVVTGSSIPTLRRGYRLFNRSIRDISLDRRTGIVTMGIAWKDRALAVKWAQDLIELTNEQLRARALSQATENMHYLSAAIGTARSENGSNALTVALANAYEHSLQAYMFASGEKEFAFRIIDPPTMPDIRERVWPRRILFVIAGAVLGVILSVFCIHLRGYGETRPRNLQRRESGLVLASAREVTQQG